MKTVLLLALGLAATGIAIAPTASACPPPEEGHPCDPMPYDPFPGQCDWKVSKSILYCIL